MTHYEKCHIDGDTTIHDELLYIGQTTCGRIEIPLKGAKSKVSALQAIMTWLLKQ